MNDQVIAAEDINPLRRRTARRLPSAIRSALNAAGFRNVTRDYAAAHDLSLALTIDDSTAAMRVERNGRVIDMFNIRTTRIADADTLAAQLVDRLAHSLRFNASMKVVPDHATAGMKVLPEVAGEAELDLKPVKPFAMLNKAAPAIVENNAKPLPLEKKATPVVTEGVVENKTPLIITEPSRITLGDPPKKDTSGDSRRVIAVFNIEDVSRSFSPDTLDQLTDYLAAKVTEVLNERVVPRETIRNRLIAEKSKGYLDCNDERCQIALGRALSAQKSLATKLLRVGNSCAIIVAVYDLETELAERAASAEMECEEERLFAELAGIVSRLVPGNAQLPPPALRRDPSVQPPMQPRDTQQRDTQPRDTQPRDTQPRDTQPRDTQPRDTQQQGTYIDASRTSLLDPFPMQTQDAMEPKERENVRIQTRTRAIPLGTRSERFLAEVEINASDNLSMRPGLNIAFVLDERLGDAAKAIGNATRYLRPNDRVSVITYSTSPSVLFSSGAPPSEDSIADALNLLSPGGVPNVGDALDAALRDVTRNIRFDRATRLILISGDTRRDSEASMRASELVAAQIAKAGASLTTISVGRNADSATMARIAELGGGRAQRIASPAELTNVLAREIQGLGVQSMGDLSIELETAPEVQFVEGALGAVRVGAARRMTVGSLVAGETRRVPIALRVRCGAPGPLTLGSVEVRYRDWSNEGRVVSKRQDLQVECAQLP